VEQKTEWEMAQKRLGGERKGNAGSREKWKVKLLRIFKVGRREK